MSSNTLYLGSIKMPPMHTSKDSMFMYLFICLCLSNLVTSSLYLHHANEVHIEIKKSGKKSSLAKKKVKTLYKIISIQLIINVVFSILNILLRRKNIGLIILGSIPWLGFSAAYYFSAHSWEQRRLNVGANVFVTLVILIFLQLCAFFPIVFMSVVEEFVRRS